ncbi:MAG: hypothetical protein ABSB49_15725, partial [Polyangia bacterium]
MKSILIIAFVVVGIGAACEPQVGAPISQVSGPAILAIKSTPAEVNPTTGAAVAFEALAVDASGRVPALDADISAPMLWAVCNQSKPPTDNNSVSTACLDTSALPGVAGPSLTTYSAPMATNACALFGPSVPPPVDGQPSISPRAPDVTGGYYQPVRTELIVPPALDRVGMSTADSLMAFQMQRISCGLANAPGNISNIYNQEYQPNNNPVLTTLTVTPPGAAALDIPAAPTPGSPISVASGQVIALTANWSPASVESYPVLNLLTQELETVLESMRVSWYVTGGSFEHDVTGQDEEGTPVQTSTPNTWTAGGAGLVHMWLVLHDARGGTDF